MSCETIDFLYPFFADVYYPTVTQTPSGKIKKEWTLNKTIVCNAASVGGAGAEEVKPEAFIQYEGKLIARAKTDIRITASGVKQSATNVLITNIRNCAGDLIYQETTGQRSGQGSVYELGTIEPFVGPFGSIEYYKMLWRKTDNQIIIEEMPVS
jgi:hypothetical protein